ncbi:MAG: hypothetical protein CMO81_06905, partial [Waddliaceae bacterium]|nr:hypothetical protein [Waddliaceae bacterium]
MSDGDKKAPHPLKVLPNRHFDAQNRINADVRPPDPSGGIPPQKMPGWIRWPLRVLLWPIVILDYYVNRLLHFFIS